MVAKAYPDNNEVGGRGKKGSAAERFPMVSKSKLSQARTVLQFAPDLPTRSSTGLWRPRLPLAPVAGFGRSYRHVFARLFLRLDNLATSSQLATV